MIHHDYNGRAFASDTVFFRAATARLAFIDSNGHAIYKDDCDNFGELRKRNGNRITFKNREEIDDFMNKH